MNKPILAVMAAGLGSRYGGLKQIDPVGKHGEVIIDYSIYDAHRAGFETVVFIIKKENETAFRQVIGDRMSKYMDVRYAFQSLDILPEGYQVPAGRTKPWGTAHAILSAADAIGDAPFAVINADDYYGPEAFQVIYDYLSTHQDGAKYAYSMVGYYLKNTVTENGYVSRGVCISDMDTNLVTVTERTHIEKKSDGIYYTEDEGASWNKLPGKTIVSMNLWGFTPSFLHEVREHFKAFLDKTLPVNPLKGEYYLPSVVSALITEEKAEVKVLKSGDTWYGVTYKEDKPVVMAALAQKHADGIYPERLWDDREKTADEVVKDILKCWDWGGEVTGTARYGQGHINDTFRVVVQEKDGTEEEYILQRINTNTFKDPVGLMENVCGVTDYLRKIIKRNGGDPDRETITVVPTREGKPYCWGPSGGAWRVYRFITHTVCLMSVDSAETFYESAYAFGNFQRLLSKFPADTLNETIAHFHDTPDRYAKFEAAVAADTRGRAALVGPEIAFARARREISSCLTDLLAAGRLPLRVTHNDTKLNNILLDEVTRKGVCVIDLDTVMPGLAAYDFGDSIRFSANHCAEDESDMSKVNFDIGLFDVYTRGFLEAAGEALTELEKETLPWGALLMTLECGVRFLTDYLQGDIYFKTDYMGQNLNRCRTQFKLASDMEKQWYAMAKVIRKYS